MPVIVDYEATVHAGTNQDATVGTAQEPLKAPASAQWATNHDASNNEEAFIPARQPSEPVNRLLESSFSNTSEGVQVPTIPYSNGFVEAIIRAFTQHLHIVLRPDDVWLAILIQFSFFAKGNPERVPELRATARSIGERHEIKIASNIPESNSALVQKFAQLIDNDGRSSVLRTWATPNFSTTTSTDKLVASVLLLASAERTSDFRASIHSGFPSVTMLGSRADWIEIFDRVGRLRAYGGNAVKWATLLASVVGNIVASFENPDSDASKLFWRQACQATRADHGFEGGPTMSGWLTAFCFFDSDGDPIETCSGDELERHLTVYGGKRIPSTWARDASGTFEASDVTELPIISVRNIPTGVAIVPMTIIRLDASTKDQITVAAGSIGVTLNNG